MTSDKYKNKYRIPTTRVSWCDYDGGEFFITVCTKDRLHYFGEIIDGVMHLSEIGKYLDSQIKITSEMRKDMNMDIPLYVIMPNHIHLIVAIGRNDFNRVCSPSDGNKFAPQSKNLASIIRGIKIATTTYARKQGIIFDWQERYHDRIIRDYEERARIADYIQNNVARWSDDCFCSQAPM